MRAGHVPPAIGRDRTDNGSLARAALAHYGLDHARLRLLRDVENATYRVDTLPDRYLLRLHGVDYHAPSAIESECAWLQAVRRDLGVFAPVPVAAAGRRFCVQIREPGSSRARCCSLLRWVRGRRHLAGPPDPRDFMKLGQLMARLHGHAERWRAPAGFRRPRWDGEGLFGDGDGFGPMASMWRAVPDRYRPRFQAVAADVERAMGRLGDGPEAFGLIHADLHLDNVIFVTGDAHPIDFDDCGHGYWVYDIAVSLRRVRADGRWSALLDAFLAGYASVRALPRGLECLDLFMAGRRVAMALWAISRAPRNPDLRRGLAERFVTTDRFIRLTHPMRRPA